MTKSFRELAEASDVTGEELVETMEEYVATGASISGHVVIELLGRTPLTTEQKIRMLEAVEKGRDDQARRGFSTLALEFREVEYFVAETVILAQPVPAH